jgi:hypothetical protein
MVCSDVWEKCTACVLRVTEASSGGCRSNSEELMCNLDRKGGNKFGNSKVWKREMAKKTCAGPMGIQTSKKGKISPRKVIP